LKQYTEIGTRISQFLYDNCSSIFGQDRWTLMVSSTPCQSSFVLPIALHRPAADAMFERSSANPSLIVARVKDVKVVIRLRKEQTAHYRRKPNRTPKDIKDDETHAYFTSVLEYVLERLVELRLRRTVETNVSETTPADICDRARDEPKKEVRPIDEAVKTFEIQVREEKETPGDDPFSRQIREDEGAEYAFSLAIYKIDVETLRAMCKIFWTLYKDSRLTSQSAAGLTNAAFPFIKTRTAEFVLETEKLRLKLAQNKTNVLPDSDPLWLLRNESMAWLEDNDPHAAELLNEKPVKGISYKSNEYMSTHFGLTIDAVIKHWREERISVGAGAEMCVSTAPLSLLGEAVESDSPQTMAHKLQEKQGSAAFFLREFIRLAGLLPKGFAGSSCCWDELTATCPGLLSHNSFDHWQLIGFEILVDTVHSLGSELRQPWNEYVDERKECLDSLCDQRIRNDAEAQDA
jgi:hypothetical protein